MDNPHKFAFSATFEMGPVGISSIGMVGRSDLSHTYNRSIEILLLSFSLSQI